MLLLNYSRKFHYHTKKIEEGDKKQKQFQVPFFIFIIAIFCSKIYWIYWNNMYSSPYKQLNCSAEDNRIKTDDIIHSVESDSKTI